MEVIKQGEHPKKLPPHCCDNRRFPTVAVIILLVGIFWLLNEAKIVAVNIPWLPIILVVVAIGWIVKFYRRRG